MNKVVRIVKQSYLKNAIFIRSQSSLTSVKNKSDKKLPNEPEVEALIKRFSALKSSKLKKPSSVYLLANSVVDNAISHLTTDLSDKTELILLDPGPSEMVRKLLENGVKKMRVFESNIQFYDEIKNSTEEYANRFMLFNGDLTKLSTLEFRQLEVVQEYFSGIKPKLWNDVPVLRFFGILSYYSSSLFIRYLIVKLCSKDSIFKYGRSEFYFYISSLEYLYFTSNAGDRYSTYRSVSVLFQLLFDIDLIEKEPIASFHPNLIYKHRIKTKYDQDHFCFVKISPKKDIFDLKFKETKLPEFLFFVKHAMNSRKNYVIPMLEKWIPKCGLRLILKGFPVFQQFGQLSPEEILVVFKEFSSWPEYEDCSFKAAMHKVNSSFIDNFPEDDDDDDV